MVKGSLLELVLPDGMAVSGKAGAEMPGGMPTRVRESLVRKNGAQWVLIHEYCGEFLTHALDHSPDYSPDHSPGKDGGRYQLEYLLHGKDNDRSNLENTVSELLIRQGINLIQILSDTEKQGGSQSLAAVITGIIGISSPCGGHELFIMTVWAMGEALEDVRCLMAGEMCHFGSQRMSGNCHWKGLLSMGMAAERPVTHPANIHPDNPKTAVEWTMSNDLKWMLFTVDQGKKQTRIMDVVQAVIQKDEPGFRLENCICDVGYSGEGLWKTCLLPCHLWKAGGRSGGL